MVDNRKSIVLNSLLAIIVFSVFAFHSKGQNGDSLIMRLYIADGFHNEKVSLSLNGTPIFSDTLVKGNFNYGFTGIFFEMKSDPESDTNWLIRNNSVSKSILKENEIRIKFRIKNKLHKYTYKIDPLKGKYVVLYKRGRKVFMDQTPFEPGFD